MSKSAMIRARIEPGLKEQAETIFKQLGLNATQAISLFYAQVKLKEGLPFELSVLPRPKRSKVAQKSTDRLIKKAKHMTPDDRLEAFFHHSSLVGQMQKLKQRRSKK